MATKMKPGPSSKVQSRRPSKPGTGASSTRSKKAGSTNSSAKSAQQKTRSTTTSTLKRKKPPHLRYTEKDLNLPKLNGIQPSGVQKAPRAKKGKNFVDDKEQMNAILAMVMAEKEGNIESKMMRARQLEEVREARRVEAEKRAEGKKAGLEERKEGIKEERRMRRRKRGRAGEDGDGVDVNEELVGKKKRKSVSFG